MRTVYSCAFRTQSTETSSFELGKSVAAGGNLKNQPVGGEFPGLGHYKDE